MAKAQIDRAVDPISGAYTRVKVAGDGLPYIVIMGGNHKVIAVTETYANANSCIRALVRLCEAIGCGTVIGTVAFSHGYVMTEMTHPECRRRVRDLIRGAA